MTALLRCFPGEDDTEFFGFCFLCYVCMFIEFKKCKRHKEEVEQEAKPWPFAFLPRKMGEAFSHFVMQSKASWFQKILEIKVTCMVVVVAHSFVTVSCHTWPFWVSLVPRALE